MASSDHDRHDEFVRLLVKNQRRVHGFILTLMPRPADAEDVMQETSVAAWNKFDSYESGTNFVRWACTIAKYEVLRFRSRQRAGQIVFDDALVESLADRCSTRSETLNQRFEVLDMCLDKLDSNDAELIQRTYKEGATTKSVAEDLGRSVDSLYKTMQRIRRALANCVRRGMKSRGYSP